MQDRRKKGHQQEGRSRRSIIVLDTDSRCHSLIKPLEANCQIGRVPHFRAWRATIQATFGSIGVIEVRADLKTPEMASFLTQIHTLNRECFGSRLFAVGKADLRLLYRVLLHAGFSQIFTSLADGPRIAQAAHCHFNALSWPLKSWQDSVFENLPWKAGNDIR